MELSRKDPSRPTIRPGSLLELSRRPLPDDVSRLLPYLEDHLCTLSGKRASLSFPLVSECPSFWSNFGAK